MPCEDQILPADLENAKLDVVTQAEIATSKEGGVSTGDLIFTSTDRFGNDHLTSEGALSRITANPINGGVWAVGITFAAYNDYMVYSGGAYKPKSTTTLPYVSEATPNAANVEPFSLSDSASVSYGTTNVEQRLDDLNVADYPAIRAMVSANLQNGQSITVTNSGIGGPGVARTGATANTITGITQAATAVVTYSGTDNWVNGDTVYINNVVGMTEVNDLRFTVANVDTGANTFELSGINSTGYTAYSSAGLVSNDNGGTIIVIDVNWYWERSYSGLIDPGWSEAAGDGTTDDRAALFAADAVGPLVISKPHAVASSLTFTNPVEFVGDGVLNIGAAATVTINEITSPVKQIFNVTTGGAVALSKKYAETSWFGAVDDGSTTATDNGPLFQLAVNAVGRSGTVVIDTGDIDTHYHFDTTVDLDFDEIVIRGRQFRTRIGADSDIVIFRQNDRTPEAYFGLNLDRLDCFNNVATGTSSVISLTRSFLFILNNVYIDKGPSHGIDLVGICAQGVLSDCVAEECQGNGFNETTGSVLLSYRDCQSFSNDGKGFASGGNAATYGNSLTGCKAFLNGLSGFDRGDAGCSIVASTARNNSTASVGTHAGITFGSSAINASAKGCNSLDDQGSATQGYGYTTNHYSQDIDNPLGSGNITALVNNNGALPSETIASGAIALPSVPQNAVIRVDTEAAAASDNLDDIQRGYTNQIITIRTVDNARNITCRDAVTSLELAGDFTTTSTADRLVLQYDREENRWCEISRSTN